MTTLREAAQQALEALELAQLNGKGGLYRDELRQLADAITALRAALADAYENEAWDAYDAALAEPVQAPVAWAHINGTSDTKWHPPQRKPLTEERNFCPRCGKRTRDIHTCTPPEDCDVHG